MFSSIGKSDRPPYSPLPLRFLKFEIRDIEVIDCCKIELIRNIITL